MSEIKVTSGFHTVSYFSIGVGAGTKGSLFPHPQPGRPPATAHGLGPHREQLQDGDRVTAPECVPKPSRNRATVPTPSSFMGTSFLSASPEVRARVDHPRSSAISQAPPLPGGELREGTRRRLAFRAPVPPLGSLRGPPEGAAVGLQLPLAPAFADRDDGGHPQGRPGEDSRAGQVLQEPSELHTLQTWGHGPRGAQCSPQTRGQLALPGSLESAPAPLTAPVPWWRCVCHQRWRPETSLPQAARSPRLPGLATDSVSDRGGRSPKI